MGPSRVISIRVRYADQGSREFWRYRSACSYPVCFVMLTRYEKNRIRLFIDQFIKDGGEACSDKMCCFIYWLLVIIDSYLFLLIVLFYFAEIFEVYRLFNNYMMVKNIRNDNAHNAFSFSSRYTGSNSKKKVINIFRWKRVIFVIKIMRNSNY